MESNVTDINSLRVKKVARLESAWSKLSEVAEEKIHLINSFMFSEWLGIVSSNLDSGVIDIINENEENIYLLLESYKVSKMILGGVLELETIPVSIDTCPIEISVDGIVASHLFIVHMANQLSLSIIVHKYDDDHLEDIDVIRDSYIESRKLPYVEQLISRRPLTDYPLPPQYINEVLRAFNLFMSSYAGGYESTSLDEDTRMLKSVFSVTPSRKMNVSLMYAENDFELVWREQKHD